MLETLMSIGGVQFIFRWLHVFAGLIWIGMLYYFNFVQGSFMNETDAPTKSQVTQKLLPRALWWFRYGALWTFLTGLVLLSILGHNSAQSGMGFATPGWTNILTGALMATLMFLNVWLVIWPAQKVVMANAKTVAEGGAANPAAAPAAARAGLASRTNTLFSVPMLFMMLGSSHLGYQITESSSLMGYWICAIALIGGLEINGLVGKLGPMKTPKGVIVCSFALTLVFIGLISILI